MIVMAIWTCSMIAATLAALTCTGTIHYTTLAEATTVCTMPGSTLDSGVDLRHTRLATLVR
jgi:hypothetical protein